MALQITMPQLGESVTEGTISRWLVSPGTSVKKYQPIAEVITDKVNAEIPAPVNGVITALHIQENQTVKVGTLIAEMEEAGAAPAPEAPVAAAAPASDAAPAAPASPATPAAPAAGPGAGRYSPAVLKLAGEHGIDLSRLTGTGLGGRITRKDVEAYIAAGGTPAAVAAPAAVPAPAAPVAPVAAPPSDCVAAQVAAAPPCEAVPAGGGDTYLEITPVRRMIAQKMVESKHNAPHAWTMVECDVTNLVKFRQSVKESFKAREGFDLTYLPFFIKAVVESLKEYPALNSTWAEDKIVLRRSLNISLAVALEDSLVVPVIHDADQKSIYGLARTAYEQVQKAKSGRLTVADVTGGTFTVNNTGAFGSVLSAPIINYPQAAIISMEAIVKRPVVLDNDAIAIRHMVNLCLSLDHRILDGLVAGRFLQAVKRRLEAYGPHTQLY